MSSGCSCDTPGVVGKAGGVPAHTPTGGSPHALVLRTTVDRRFRAEMVETRRWVKLCGEPIWQPEQKPYPKTKQAETPQARPRQGRACQQIFISTPGFVFRLSPPRETSWTQNSGSRWEAGDFLPECSKGNTLESMARLFLSFEGHEFRVGQVPLSAFCSVTRLCTSRGNRDRITPSYWKSVGSLSGASVFLPTHMYL